MFSPRAAVRREARDAFMAAVGLQLKILAQLGGPRRRQKSIGDLSLGEYLALEKGEHEDEAAPPNGETRPDSPDSEAETRTVSQQAPTTTRDRNQR